MAEKSKRTGFVQSLFNGLIDKDLFKPYPAFKNEEREEMLAVLNMVKRFAKEQIDPVKIDLEHNIPDSIKDGIKELGLWGLIIPEEYSGFAQPDFTYNKTMEILHGRCSSTAVMYGGHLSIGLKAILLFGTDEQKQKFLPELASGEKIAAFALTEPGAGSDAANIKTTAKLSDDGKYYILNGRKQWITNGSIADVFTVLAKVYETDSNEKAGKLTTFIVTRDMAGFSSGKEEDKLGICGSSTTPLTLENVKVPVENVLGEVGSGFKIFMEVLNTGRLSLSAGLVGAAKAIIPDTLEFALQREQFGKTISQFEMIKEKFARILTNTFTAESMVYYSTCLKDNLGVSIAIEAAICKVFSSEALWQTVNDCLQIAGGNGYMKEYPYERFLRDARINMIFEGTNEIQRMFIALSGLRQLSVMLQKYQKEISETGKSREKQIDEIYQNIISSNKSLKIDGFSEKLQGQIALATSLTQQLNQVAIKAILQHGQNIKEMQYIQKRIADAAVDLFGIFANIARVENLISKKHHSAENAILISHIFSQQAKRRINNNLNDVKENQDAAVSELAEILYSNGKYPFDILD